MQVIELVTRDDALKAVKEKKNKKDSLNEIAGMDRAEIESWVNTTFKDLPKDARDGIKTLALALHGLLSK